MSDTEDVEQATAVLDQAQSVTSRARSARSAARHLGVRRSWVATLLTLLAIMGPGLIVMVGDNDAGGVSTYAEAGQNYGLTCSGRCPC